MLRVRKLTVSSDSPSVLSYLIRFIFSFAQGGVWYTSSTSIFQDHGDRGNRSLGLDLLSVLGLGRKSVVMLNLRTPAASFHFPLRSSLILTHISASDILVFRATS